MTRIIARLEPATNGSRARTLKLVRAVADFSESGKNVAGAIDANDSTGWAVYPETSQPHVALFELAEPVTENEGMALRVTFEFKSKYQQHGLGRFRLSASPNAVPLDREQLRLPAMKLADPWAKLAAAYYVVGNQRAGDKLIKGHARVAGAIADLYAAARDWERAIAAYRKLLADEPTDIALLAKLITACQSAGRSREAVPYLAKLSAANPKDTELWIEVASRQAWFGQDQDLATTRQRILALAMDTSSMLAAERAAKVCCILPSTDKADLEAALALARKAVEVGKGGDWNLLTLGMAEYRSGHDAAAAETLLAAAKAGSKNYFVTGTAAFYRAMSLYRLGKPDEARKVAIEAVAKMRPLPNPSLDNPFHRDDLVLWLAYKEAKTMIKYDEAPPPETKGNQN